MSEVKSDIQIAREAKMQPINDILAKVNVPDESSAFSPMGRHIAKVNLEYLDTLKDKPDDVEFYVTNPVNKEKATFGNGTQISFLVNSKDLVNKFYNTGIKLGGADEGAPGIRSGDYYCYFRDLDKNKICAFAKINN